MATFINVTLDDFDPPLVYSTPSDWSTPDPSLHPERFNQTTQQDDDSSWWQGTYHSTTVDGAQLAFNFSGRSLYIYGTSSPSPPTITLTSLTSSNASDRPPATYSTPADPLPDGVLFAAVDLDPADQLAVLVQNTAGGSAAAGSTTNNLTLDRVVFEAPVGAEGSDDGSSLLTYTGAWSTNALDLFWAGGSSYTNEDGATVRFAFEGSAVWIYGDQVNDHGPYTVSVNGSTVAHLSGASGCGGGWGKTCEKLGAVHWFAGGLGKGRHEVEVRNVDGGNGSYFDLDYITYLTPSSYYVPSNTTTPSASSSSSSSAAAAASASASASQAVGGGTSAASRSVDSPSPLLGLVAFGLVGLCLGRAAGGGAW